MNFLQSLLNRRLAGAFTAVLIIATFGILSWQASAQRRGDRRMNPPMVSAPETISAAGDLDPSFGTGEASVAAGVSKIFIGASSDASETVESIAFQTVGANAGKIVGAGQHQKMKL